MLNGRKIKVRLPFFAGSPGNVVAGDELIVGTHITEKEANSALASNRAILIKQSMPVIQAGETITPITSIDGVLPRGFYELNGDLYVVAKNGMKPVKQT